ncbi:MAG: glycoside hydrolase family 127 protein [Bacteroidales bacterium]|nr:glycoside hydrolase family 127 protein [Bacteroidales bacterium]
MNKLFAASVLILLPVFLTGQGLNKKAVPGNIVSDKIFSYSPNSIKIEGYLGGKINLVIGQRIKAQDVDHLVEPFRHKNETRLWQSEFWGKWIQSAIAAYDYNRDPEILIIIKKAVSDLLATQMPSGYIGNYSDSAQLQHWDIWGRKYTMLGLLAYYDLSGDKEALKTSKRLADHLISQVGPGKADIVKTGNYRGMPSSSILEPMVYLYRRTGDKKYLDFAKYIVEQWETPDGPKLISSALADIPVSERFPHPSTWWSYENGQKAYEMMSCYEGLLELYRITGEPKYLKAVEMAVSDIIESEINIAGSGTAFECFYKGAKYQTEPTYHTMETCVTMTWMKLCFSLLRLTGNPMYADQIEKSTYNALMASVKYDGSQIAKYSPLGGVRHAGEEQCGMHINCCNANGPRAFMMLPRFAIMGAQNEIYINLYGQNESVIPISQKNKVGIDQISDYPVSDKIEININPDKPESFTIAFRIPSWSETTIITVNGTEETGTTAGTYKKITRVWSKADKVVLRMDLKGQLVTLNGQQAIVRGPVVLARDARFGDGFIYESAVVKEKNGQVDLLPSLKKPANVWMSFTAPLVLGTDLEGEYRNPKQVNFCDFASAGNTWGEDSRYKVWIPQTLNVMKTDYKSY